MAATAVFTWCEKRASVESCENTKEEVREYKNYMQAQTFYGFHYHLKLCQQIKAIIHANRTISRISQVDVRYKNLVAHNCSKTSIDDLYAWSLEHGLFPHYMRAWKHLSKPLKLENFDRDKFKLEGSFINAIMFKGEHRIDMTKTHVSLSIDNWDVHPKIKWSTSQ